MTNVFRKEYKALTDQQSIKINDIKNKAQELYELYGLEIDISFDPRMLELAKTNLEQSVMWAIKSIT